MKAIGLISLTIYFIVMSTLIDLPYNTASTGLTSKFYLFKMFFDMMTACICIWKVWENTTGVDTILHMHTGEGYVDIPTLHLPNLWFYSVLMLYSSIMFFQAVDANSSSTGFESIWFAIWAIADFAVFTFSAWHAYIAYLIISKRRKSLAN